MPKAIKEKRTTIPRFPSIWTALCCAILAILARPTPAKAGDEVQVPPALTVPHLPSAPALNGTLDSAWKAAAIIHLTHEATYRKSAPEDTMVHVGMYAGSLYVAFEAYQREPIVASQVSDGTGVLTGDAVMVHLWPDGLQGFAYWFATNVHGARDQYSSENSSYAPQWTAYGKRTPYGYLAILKIPLSAMHVQAGANWRAQFHRIVVATNSNYVWELEPGQSSYIDGRYGGRLLGLHSAAVARARPRLQVYGLGLASSSAHGGFASRIGADFSLPVTATTSLFGTAHPDFSNVEIDQQSIAPTEFARRFVEVRPFFTQALGSFNQQPDFGIPMATLYTPAIPGFRDGYGVEGRQGLVSFGAFDASGDSRNDNAAAVSISDPLQRLSFTYQRVGVDVASPNGGGFHDVVNDEGVSLFNPHSHLTFFANSGRDSGTFVSDAASATYQDLGAKYSTATSTLAFALQKMGPQFNPADGYSNQPPGELGIAGYTAYGSRQINYSSTSRILDIGLSAAYDRYHGPSGDTNQADFSDEIRVDFKDQLTVSVMQMLSSLATCAPIDPSTCRNALLPYNGGSVSVGYALNTAHPSSISYTTGQYYHGTLTSWQRTISIPLSFRAALSFEADDTLYHPGFASEPSSKQWLERAGASYQFNRWISADLGIRRIIGTNQPFAFAPFGPSAAFTQSVCSGNDNVSFIATSGCTIDEDATNVSAALHFFRGNNEFYLVYGNPNELMTRPTLYMKLIRYLGAGKGT